MPDRPLLIRTVNRVERTLGGPLESLADSKRFVDVVAFTMRLERAAQGVFERQTRSFLHFWNVPAQTDIKRLTRQVSALSNELRTITVQLEDERESAREQAADRDQGRV